MNAQHLYLKLENALDSQCNSTSQDILAFMDCWENGAKNIEQKILRYQAAQRFITYQNDVCLQSGQSEEVCNQAIQQRLQVLETDMNRNIAN